MAMNAGGFEILVQFGAGGGFLIGVVPVEFFVDTTMRWIGLQRPNVRSLMVATGNGIKGILGLAWLPFVFLYLYLPHRTIVGGNGDYGPVLEALRPWVVGTTWLLAFSACAFGHSLLYWRRWSDDPGTGPLTGNLVLLLFSVVSRWSGGVTLPLPIMLFTCVVLALHLGATTKRWAAPVGVVGICLLDGAFARDLAPLLLAPAAVVTVNLLLPERWRRTKLQS